MTVRTVRRIRLSVEALEPREVPAGGPWTSESFDTFAVGKQPPGWVAWGSDGDSGIRVADARALQGRALAATGTSAQAGRIWLPTTVSANATVTAAIYVDGLIPGQVFARGSNLAGTTPTYYAASVVRGVEVKLIKVVDGKSTDLGTLKSKVYLSGVWLDLSLTTQGDRQQVRVRRRDTGSWLNSFGEWQSSAAATLIARDSSIPAAGRVGVDRPASYSGTVSFDEVRVTPASGDLIAPVVAASVRSRNLPVRKGTVSGSILFTGAIRDAGRIAQVEFLVDGTLIGRRTGSPYRMVYDSRNLSNGRHTLAIRAWDAAGNVGDAQATFEVFNPAATDRPDVPRHYSHVRYATLAYNGTTIGPEEKDLLRESIDLVVPNARYLANIDLAAPATPQLIYSNISNLYLDLLTDWLAYADRTGASREGAFYHVAQPTPFLGDSPSSQPVTWMWNVQRGPIAAGSGYTKLTGESRTAGRGDIALGGTGEAVYAGYPERFRELNISVYQAPAVGWAGVWEYPSRVDRHGRPLEWKALPLISDTTQGFRRSGQIAFDPPSDWRPSQMAGSSELFYYARIRTTAGRSREVPIVSAILGRDYVAANRNRSGTIPAFDAAADVNRDGYLNNAEYARRRSGLDARFEYESRLFYPYYGQMRFVTNPSGRGVAAWASEYHRELMAANPLADGVFMDNSGGRAPTDRAVLVESIDTYASDYGAVLGTVNRAIAPNWVLANTSGGGADADRVVRQVPATIEEFALRPLGHNWVQFDDMAKTVARRLALVDPPGYLILDTLSIGGSPTDERTRIAALAYYYLLADPEATFLMTWGGEEPASAWTRHWFDAIATDVGRPRSAWTESASGVDPTNEALTYRVLQREYDRAVVLYKPLSYAAGKGTGNTSDQTATTHTLNGNYRPLRADGTLGPATSTVSLRNGEGAILIRA